MKNRVQQKLLLAMDVDRCLTLHDLVTATGMQRGTISHAAGRLIARGFAVRAEKGCFWLTPAGEAFRLTGKVITCAMLREGPSATNMSALQQRVWQALRMMGKASYADIGSLALSEGDRLQTIRDYITLLNRANYVRELPREPGSLPRGPGYKRFLLLRNTGPIAPYRLRKEDVLYDPNLDIKVPFTKVVTRTERKRPPVLQQEVSHEQR